MHKASRVYETVPSTTPEGGEDRWPSIPAREPDAAVEDRSRQPEGQRDSSHPQKRAGTRWGASNEGATSSGRKKTTQQPPRTSRGRTRGFQSPESQRTGDQQRTPGRQNSNHGITSGRATNDVIEWQARPNATAGWRTGQGSDKEAQTQDEAFETAPKWLILHLKQKGTAEPPLRMQMQPQLPYTMTAPSNYRRKWGSSTPHIERRHCSHTSETTEGWGTTNVPTPSRISRLARQPHSPYR